MFPAIRCRDAAAAAPVPVETVAQRGACGAGRIRPAEHDDVDPVQAVLVHAEGLSHRSFDPVSARGEPAVFSCYGEAQARAGSAVVAPQDGEVSIAASSCVLENTAKGGSVGQAIRSGEAGGVFHPPGDRFDRNRRRKRYGVSRVRPLARRRLRMARPAFVAMRARKPCVRARLILLGWNVRFIADLPDCLRSGLSPARKRAGKGTRGHISCQ